MNKYKPFFSLIFICLVLVILSMVSCGDDDDDDDDDAPQEVWEDSSSGLIWQNDSACCYNWKNSKSYCKNLNWGGYNDWRLPSISELRSLIRGCEITEVGGACGVTNDCTNGDNCYNDLCNYGCMYGGGFGLDGCYWPLELKGNGNIFWSSTENSSPLVHKWSVESTWSVDFTDASVLYEEPSFKNNVRCVRNVD